MVEKNEDIMPIQTRQPIKVLPDGTYNLVVKNVVHREKNSYGNPDFMFVFTVADGPEAGNPVFEFTPAFLSPGKKLWNLLLILGYDPKTISGGLNRSTLVGRKVTALLGLHPKGHRNKIISMFPGQPQPAVGVTAAAPVVAPVTSGTPVLQPAPITSAPAPQPVAVGANGNGTKVNDKVTNLDDITDLIQF